MEDFQSPFRVLEEFEPSEEHLKEADFQSPFRVLEKAYKEDFISIFMPEWLSLYFTLGLDDQYSFW